MGESGRGGESVCSYRLTDWLAEWLTDRLMAGWYADWLVDAAEYYGWWIVSVIVVVVVNESDFEWVVVVAVVTSV